MRTERYGRDVPLLLRLFRCWGIQGETYRFQWGELSLRYWGLALQYSVHHEDANFNIHLGPINLFLKMPMLITQRPHTEDWNATFGFTWHGRAIHFNWRCRCKCVSLPWDWQHVRTSILRPDGSIFYTEPSTRSENWHEHYKVREKRIAEVSETHPYHYLLLPDGEVQKRQATIYGDEMEWRWKWFTWLPWPNMKKRCISVAFDAEVGERTGSWKGGCTGCGYEWRDGERMKDALRRMERERRFT